MCNIKATQNDRSAIQSFDPSFDYIPRSTATFDPHDAWIVKWNPQHYEMLSPCLSQIPKLSKFEFDFISALEKFSISGHIFFISATDNGITLPEDKLDFMKLKINSDLHVAHFVNYFFWASVHFQSTFHLHKASTRNWKVWILINDNDTLVSSQNYICYQFMDPHIFYTMLNSRQLNFYY